MRGIVEQQDLSQAAEGADTSSYQASKRSYTQELAVRRKRISTAKERNAADDDTIDTQTSSKAKHGGDLGAPSPASNILAEDMDPLSHGRNANRGANRTMTFGTGNNLKKPSGLQNLDLDDDCTDEHNGGSSTSRSYSKYD